MARFFSRLLLMEPAERARLAELIKRTKTAAGRLA